MPTSDLEQQEYRPVKNVRHVVMNDIGRLVVSQANEESLMVESDRHMLPNIQTEMVGDCLELGMSRSWSERIANSFTLRHVTYYLTIRELESIELKGISNLEMGPYQGKMLEVSTRGHISVKIEELAVKKFSGRFHWSSNVTVSGSAVQQEIVLSGSSKYRALDLASQQASFLLSDKSIAEVQVENKIVVESSGESFLQYKGNPRLVTKNRDSSSIQRRTF
jgi:hypothetical protein